MKRSTPVLGVPILSVLFSSFAAAASMPDAGRGHAPFVANHGQWPDTVQFRAVGDAYTFDLLEDGFALWMHSPSGVVGGSMHFVDANTQQITGLGALESYSNYLVGNDPEAWHSRVPHFERVQYRELIPGVDVVYYWTGALIEFDLLVAPGADPDAIEMQFSGASRVEKTADGSLQLQFGERLIKQRKPVVYQVEGGQRREVSGSYLVTDSGSVKLAVADYDRSAPLIIDPILEYGTYFGGSGSESTGGLSIDANGHVYIFGRTNSTDLPGTGSTFVKPSNTVDASRWESNRDSTLVENQNSRVSADGQPSDWFVSKLDPATNSLIYTTIIGGSGDEDLFMHGGITGNNEPVIAGNTLSSDFPLVNAAQGHQATAAVAKLSADGTSLIYSTYFGGTLSGGGQQFWNTSIRDLYVTQSGAVTLMGDNDLYDFPATGALNGYECMDGFKSGAGLFGEAFVARLSSVGELDFAKCIGGNGRTNGRGVVLDPTSGNWFITGYTFITDFLVDPIQDTVAGDRDGFVAVLAADGSSLLAATLWGGSDLDFPETIAADPFGNVIIAGGTSSRDYPVVNAVQSTFANEDDPFNQPGDAFVTKFSGDLSTVSFSSFLGGSTDEGFLDESFWASATDSQGRIYLAGITSSTDFPLRNPVKPNLTQGFDNIVVAFEPDGQLLYSTYLGGSKNESNLISTAATAAGDLYVVSSTDSDDINLVAPFQQVRAGSFDAYLTRLSLGVDSDVDGAPDQIEDAAPNDGDGNNDGIPDSQQNYVASFLDLSGSYVTIADNNALPISVQADSVTLVAPIGSTPNGFQFCRGMFLIEFGLSARGGGRGGTASVSAKAAIDAPPGVVRCDLEDFVYQKYGPTPENPVPHWYDFNFDGTTGATCERDGFFILCTIVFVDGLRGDSDLEVNGVIVDPGGFAISIPDTDGDGLTDNEDNCQLVANPNQRDTDADGIGNFCDSDLDNDCAINFSDLAVFKSVFFTADGNSDFDGDGAVNFTDLAILKEQFFALPGPSGIANDCE